VDYVVSERQLFPKAAVQPSTWQAKANVALGSVARFERPVIGTRSTVASWPRLKEMNGCCQDVHLEGQLTAFESRLAAFEDDPLLPLAIQKTGRRQPAGDVPGAVIRCDSRNPDNRVERTRASVGAIRSLAKRVPSSPKGTAHPTSSPSATTSRTSSSRST